VLLSFGVSCLGETGRLEGPGVGSREIISPEGRPCYEEQRLWAYFSMAPLPLALPEAVGKFPLILPLRLW